MYTGKTFLTNILKHSYVVEFCSQFINFVDGLWAEELVVSLWLEKTQKEGNSELISRYFAISFINSICPNKMKNHICFFVFIFFPSKPA